MAQAHQVEAQQKQERCPQKEWHEASQRRLRGVIDDLQGKGQGERAEPQQRIIIADDRKDQPRHGQLGDAKEAEYKGAHW